ncbi:MAG: hypothetical protein JXB49_32370 [Bacteroidales bacterium]|nr:hypothetical protein [Bacteroidales bacterium]
MEPILTHTFDYSRIVTCGFCNGSGQRDVGYGMDICTYCHGSGKLLDVRRGTMSLYPFKEDENTE